MMKLKMVVVCACAIFAGAFGIGYFVNPPKAYCTYCNTLPCYNGGMCGKGCVCVKRGLDLQGFCASLN